MRVSSVAERSPMSTRSGPPPADSSAVSTRTRSARPPVSRTIRACVPSACSVNSSDSSVPFTRTVSVPLWPSTLPSVSSAVSFPAPSRIVSWPAPPSTRSASSPATIVSGPGPPAITSAPGPDSMVAGSARPSMRISSAPAPELIASLLTPAKLWSLTSTSPALPGLTDDAVVGRVTGDRERAVRDGGQDGGVRRGGERDRRQDEGKQKSAHRGILGSSTPRRYGGIPWTATRRMRGEGRPCLKQLQARAPVDLLRHPKHVSSRPAPGSETNPKHAPS